MHLLTDYSQFTLRRSPALQGGEEIRSLVQQRIRFEQGGVDVKAKRRLPHLNAFKINFTNVLGDIVMGGDAFD